MSLAFSLSRLASASSSLGVLFFAPGVRAMPSPSSIKKRYFYRNTEWIAVYLASRFPTGSLWSPSTGWDVGFGVPAGKVVALEHKVGQESTPLTPSRVFVDV